MNLNELGSKQLMRILEVFLETPSKDWEQARLRDSLKFSKTTIIKWVNFLLKEQIIKEKRIGRIKIMHLNNESTIVKEIKRFSIILKLDKLKKIASETRTRIYLYGSCARGEYYEDSDVDLLIIGAVKRADIIGAIKKVEDELKRKINFQIFTNIEWSNMRIKDKPFYERTEKDKVALE
jgi:predicted nucleotidyltransferase